MVNVGTRARVVDITTAEVDARVVMWTLMIHDRVTFLLAKKEDLMMGA